MSNLNSLKIQKIYPNSYLDNYIFAHYWNMEDREVTIHFSTQHKNMETTLF